MWLYTEIGHFSVVRATDEDRFPIRDHLAVRARKREHLVALAELTGLYSSAEIIVTPHADYTYRVILPKQHWASCLSRLSDGIDYFNFKGRVDHKHGNFSDYSLACHAVHSACNAELRAEKDLLRKQ